MANYPNGIDTFTTVKPDDEMLGHASKHNNEAGAIVAIETELGENPSGSFDSVSLRLDGVDAAISSIEIYDDTVLSEAVTKNTKDIADIETYDDTVVKADIAKNTEDIAKNTKDIADLEAYDDTVVKADIVKNTEDIAKNTKDIADLEAYDDTAVKADIDKNTRGVAENAQTLSDLTTATLPLENPENINTLFSVLSTQQQANEYFASEIKNKVSVATTWGQLAGI